MNTHNIMDETIAMAKRTGDKAKTIDYYHSNNGVILTKNLTKSEKREFLCRVNKSLMEGMRGAV